MMDGRRIPARICLVLLVSFFSCNKVAIVANISEQTDGDMDDSDTDFFNAPVTDSTDTNSDDSAFVADSDTTDSNTDTDILLPVDTDPMLDGLPDGIGWYAGSYLGSAANQSIGGVGIQLNGTIVMASQLAEAALGSTEHLLGSATAASPGTVVRMDAWGRRVLSVTRIVETISDLTVDPRDDTIYLACEAAGLFKLTPDADQVLWHKSFVQAVYRVDVGEGGTVAVLTGDARRPASPVGIEGASVYTFDSDGNALGSRSGYGVTADVCIDDGSGVAVLIGWREVEPVNAPTHIPFLVGYTLKDDMPLKWRGYDFDETMVNFGDSTAATWGTACETGVGGTLAAVFTVSGGNHILRYDPQQIDQAVGDRNVGADAYHQLYNSHSEAKTVVGRYSSATGELKLQTQFCARDADNAAATAEPRTIYMDALGNVYLGGYAEASLPLSDNAGFDPFAVVPQEETDAGGGWLLVLSEAFTPRTLCTRMGKDATTIGVSARRMANGETMVVMAGDQPQTVESGIALWYPVQETRLPGTQTGWFAVFGM